MMRSPEAANYRHIKGISINLASGPNQMDTKSSSPSIQTKPGHNLTTDQIRRLELQAQESQARLRRMFPSWMLTGSLREYDDHRIGIRGFGESSSQ